MRDEELTGLCRELIRRPSVSGEERAVAEFLRDTMVSLGYPHVEIDRYGSVLGWIPGCRPGKTVLMDGHIDTVPVEDPGLWTHDPFAGEVEGERLYGRGASDMKGGVAAMVLAAARFAKDSGGDFAGTICVSCSVQEGRFEGVACRGIARLAQPDTVVTYSEKYRNPYAVYTTEDGSRYKVWYEDAQSVADKLQLARMFGITGVPLWRVGTIPASSGYDVWSAVQAAR